MIEWKTNDLGWKSLNKSYMNVSFIIKKWINNIYKNNEIKTYTVVY
jgi:hypothetical protein